MLIIYEIEKTSDYPSVAPHVAFVSLETPRGDLEVDDIVTISGSDPYYNKSWVVAGTPDSFSFLIIVGPDAPSGVLGGVATPGPTNSAQTVTFIIPKVPRTYTEDDGSIVNEELEIYETFVDDSPESATVILQATSDSGLTDFTYTSSDPAVALVFDGNKLKMLQRAEATITAIQPGNAQYISSSASATISPPDLPATQTLTITLLSDMQPGQFADFSVSSSAGLAVSVRSFSPEIVEIVGSQLHALLPGGAIIEFSAPGNETYAEVTETFFVFVEGLPQTVTFSPVPSLAVGDEVTLSATSSAGLAVAFSSSDPSVMPVTGAQLKVLRQGYSIITATAEASPTYSPASASQDVVVGSSGQSIIFPTIPEVPYGAAGYVVAVFATSGLPVTLASSNPSVAIVLGNTLSISGVGTTTITASQAGNPFWLPATSQQQLLRVVKAEQGLNFTRPPSLIPVGARVLLGASTTSGEPAQFFATGALAIEDGYLVGKTIGTGTVTATVAETDLYKPASVTYEVTVGKLDQAISFADVQIKSFTDFPFRLDVSSNSQLSVALTSSNPSTIEITDGNLATIKGTGVVTIEAAQTGDSTYNSAPSVTRQIAVERGVQAIAFQDIAPVAFGGPSFSLRASAPGGSVAFASSNPSVARVENGNQLVIVGLGVARIIATQAGNQNYFSTSAVQSVIVLPTISSAVGVTKGNDDTEAHSSLTSSPASGATAVSVSAPSIEDREAHLSISPSPALNCGGSQISLGTRDTEDHQSLTASPGFSGAAFNMGSVQQGTDESGYLVALSPAYTGASPAVGAATEFDISDYRAWLASAASSAASVVARYDGRNEFEVYFAPTAYEPVGFLKWSKSGVSGRILNRRVNEDGLELKGKIAI
jgi:hypothetical protein